MTDSPQGEIGMGGLITRIFGSTGRTVTQVGLGGEGILRSSGEHERARTVIESAFAAGIRYFDSAPAYAGSEGYYGAFWRSHPDKRDEIFQTSKSANRSREGAERDLHRTLDTMGIRALDLWQIHDVRDWSDIRRIEGPEGALEAFTGARERGLVRYIGVTGHHSPEILTYAVEHWPMDAVLLPVNPVEGVLGGFLDRTLPAATDLGLAVIAMKVLGASHYLYPEVGITADLLLNYALSQPITGTIIGCSTPGEVMLLAEAGRRAEILPDEDQRWLEDAFRPYAKRMAYYRGVV
jgi:aryl-alcohol dehydrogenase-like predicted oxidoreductase